MSSPRLVSTNSAPAWPRLLRLVRRNVKCGTHSAAGLRSLRHSHMLAIYGLRRVQS